MRKPLWKTVLMLLLLLSLTACKTMTPLDESMSADRNVLEISDSDVGDNFDQNDHEHKYVATDKVAASCTSEGYTVYLCDCGDTYTDDMTEQLEHIYEDTVVPATEEDEGYTLHLCTVCSYAYKDNYTDKVIDDGLTAEQKNSIAMLNYLATLTQEINASKNSRVFLENAYASLINNTNPEEVNELAADYLDNLLGTIKDYRVLTIKWERLEYLYNQNKAKAIQEAIPSPKALLSAAASLDVKRLVASIATMAIDSISSYNAYNDELDQAFLQDGWALNDEEANVLHESRSNAFSFMLKMVRENNLPGELTLSENAVVKFVTWITNDNLTQRLQFLKSEENTYRGFGRYWLALAECYFELNDYDSCLNAIERYKEYRTNIFRKDYDFAQILPMAIASASEIYSEDDYIIYVEEHLKILLDNIEKEDWALNYFAAQIYTDLYNKTKDIDYLEQAYDIARNNVNVLVKEQEKMTADYLADVQEVTIAEGASKEEEKKIKDYNKSLKEKRKTELPPVYEPLLLNCELLFTLAEMCEISSDERETIDNILENDSFNVFLTVPLINRYASEASKIDVTATFEKSALTIPVCCVSANSVVRVSVIEGGKTTVYDDWIIKEVRRMDKDPESFVVTYASEKTKDQTWSADSVVLVEIFDEADSKYEPLVIRFKVSKYNKIVWEYVEFEQVN